MNTKKVLVLLGVVLLVLGVGAAIRYPLSAPQKEPPHETTGEPETEEGVVCTGYVDLEHGIRSLAPLRPGRVAEILIKENQHVEAGTPLLRLETEDAKFQVDAAQSALSVAQVQLEEALKGEEQQRRRLAQQEAALKAAGFRLDAARVVLRHKEKQSREVVTPEEVSTTRDEVKALEQAEIVEREKLAAVKAIDPDLAVRKARAELNLARTRCAEAQHQLTECTLKAPAAGTVQRITVGAGDIATANPAQSIVRFCPDETPLIRAEVNQEFADRVKVGQSAVIRDDANSRVSWRGKVERIAGFYQQRRPTTQDPSEYVDVRTVECWITLDSGQPPPRIGQRMRVLIGRVPAEPRP